MAYVGKTRRYLNYKLNKDMKRGRLTSMEDLPRGIGKTSLIAKLAKENGWVVVQPNLNHLNYFKKLFPDIECTTARAIEIGDHRKFILDEGISAKEEKHLRNKFTVVGGFSGKDNTYYSYIKDGELNFDKIGYCRDKFKEAGEGFVNIKPPVTFI